LIEISSPSESTVVCRPVGDLAVAGSLHLRHVVADLVRTGLNLEIDLGLVGNVDAIGVSAVIGAMRMVHSSAGPPLSPTPAPGSAGSSSAWRATASPTTSR
jgi:hypothetical protein